MLKTEVDGEPPDLPDVSADTAIAVGKIIEKHRIVNWTHNADVQKSMINDIDDYLFDVVRDERGVPVSNEVMDSIIERVMQIARLRMAA